VVAVLIPERGVKVEHPIPHLEVITDEVMVLSPSSVESRDGERVPVEGRPMDDRWVKATCEPREVDSRMPTAPVMNHPPACY
jgi:hypothetical protein